MKKLIIVVDKGVVQQVRGVSKGVIVEVRDYDNREGRRDNGRLRTDSKGNPYRVGSWRSSGIFEWKLWPRIR